MSTAAQISETSDTVKIFKDRKEARRQRRELKASGDYLGVQGVNPQTGELDVLTPTSSSESPTLFPPVMTAALTNSASNVRTAKQAYQEARSQHKAEIQRAQAAHEQDKHDKAQRQKDVIRVEQRQVRWRKDEARWSSVAEPNLSPIAQSQGTGTSCKFTSPCVTRGTDHILSFGQLEALRKGRGSSASAIAQVCPHQGQLGPNRTLSNIDVD